MAPVYLGWTEMQAGKSTAAEKAFRAALNVDAKATAALYGTAQIKDGYAQVRDGELWLHNVHIPPYGPASRENHDPDRPRKLLAHRREIDRMVAQTQERGLTLVPTRLYFSGPRAKVEIALAKGKDVRDKREASRHRTRPTSPTATAAIKRSKPSRRPAPTAALCPRSMSMMSTRSNPSARARSAQSYCKRWLSVWRCTCRSEDWRRYTIALRCRCRGVILG